MSARHAEQDTESELASPAPSRAPDLPAPPAPAGVPLWVGIVIILVGVLACGGVLVARWQREQGYQAETAALDRAAATAEAARAVSATATAVARPTPDASVPVLNVERVEPPNSPLARELQAAERQYWQVYADALYTLNTSQLSQIAAGEELQRMIERIDELRARERVLQLRIDHYVKIFNATPTRAYLRDQSTDRSVLLDTVTKLPVPTLGSDLLVGTRRENVFVYERIDGVWKVTGSSRVLDSDFLRRGIEG